MTRPDLSDQFNTALDPQQEAAFQQWAASHGRQGDLQDYDLRGAFAHDAKAAGNGHLPDTWKKPNHPTFSVESQYSTPEARGGQWVDGGDGKWLFMASPYNVDNLGAEQLNQYFKQREPDSGLVLPDPGRRMAQTLDSIFAARKPSLLPLRQNY